MRRLAALAVIAAIVTLVPMVAWASMSSATCCAAKQPPPPMSCCKATKCSMSKTVPVPVVPNEAESTPETSKIAVPGAAILDGVAVATVSVSARTAANRDAAPAMAVTVDRRLALLSTFLI